MLLWPRQTASRPHWRPSPWLKPSVTQVQRLDTVLEMPTPFDPVAVLRVLDQHNVRFVVIGGFAAIYHGSAHLTSDVDITPDTSLTNMAALSTALTALDARIRVIGEDPLPFAHDATSLARATVWNLTTRFGDLDISCTPSGTTGYADLHRDAERADVLGVDVEIAALADIIRSKEAAGRPKDLLTLPTLRRLLEERNTR